MKKTKKEKNGNAYILRRIWQTESPAADKG